MKNINHLSSQFYCVVLALLVACSSEKESDLLFSCDDSDLALEVVQIESVTCSGLGSLTVMAQGGDGNYSYSIDGISFQNEVTFSELPVGDYTITVKDGADCSSTVQTSIASSDDAISLIASTVTSENCSGADGSVTLTAEGGDGSFSYSLAEGDFQDSNVFSNLPAGSYTFIARDGSGCESSVNVVVGTDSGDLSLDVETSSEADCGTENGTVSLTASGGDGDYSFSLDGSSPQSEATFSGLAIGVYDALVTDGNSCSSSTQVEISSSTSLTTDIMPIITANCSISGCHNGTQSPNLSTPSGVIGSATRIKARTTAGTMPQSGPLPQGQIDLIACWVDAGARDN